MPTVLVIAEEIQITKASGCFVSVLSRPGVRNGQLRPCVKKLPIVELILRLDSLSYVQVGLPKDYRFQTHHRLLYPTPQYMPAGYAPEVIQHARTLLTCNGVVFVSGWPLKLAEDEDLQGASNQFLMDVDFHVHGIAEWIQQGISTDFASMGLVSFQADLRERVRVFDAMWVEFEERICVEIEKVMKEVFKPVDAVVVRTSDPQPVSSPQRCSAGPGATKVFNRNTTPGVVLNSPSKEARCMAQSGESLADAPVGGAVRM